MIPVMTFVHLKGYESLHFFVFYWYDYLYSKSTSLLLSTVVNPFITIHLTATQGLQQWLLITTAINFPGERLTSQLLPCSWLLIQEPAIEFLLLSPSDEVRTSVSEASISSPHVDPPRPSEPTEFLAGKLPVKSQTCQDLGDDNSTFHCAPLVSESAVGHHNIAVGSPRSLRFSLEVNVFSLRSYWDCYTNYKIVYQNFFFFKSSGKMTFSPYKDLFQHRYILNLTFRFKS